MGVILTFSSTESVKTCKKKSYSSQVVHADFGIIDKFSIDLERKQLSLKISVPAHSEESEVTAHFNIRLHCQDRLTAPQGEHVSDLMIMEPPAACCQEMSSCRIGCGCPIILKLVSRQLVFLSEVNEVDISNKKDLV